VTPATAARVVEDRGFGQTLFGHFTSLSGNRGSVLNCGTVFDVYNEARVDSQGEDARGKLKAGRYEAARPLVQTEPGRAAQI
jgi:hypothetical protein